jgi:hypothetical protein
MGFSDMIFGQFSSSMVAQQKEEPATTEKPPEEHKSGNADEFLQSTEAKKFVEHWSKQQKNGEPLYTKRGVTALLRALYPGFNSNKKLLAGADEVLKMLGGMDGLQGFLMGWKAKSEGLIKGIKSILGGK